jgi:hypothetical protein
MEGLYMGKVILRARDPADVINIRLIAEALDGHTIKIVCDQDSYAARNIEGCSVIANNTEEVDAFLDTFPSDVLVSTTPGGLGPLLVDAARNRGIRTVLLQEQPGWGVPLWREHPTDAVCVPYKEAAELIDWPAQVIATGVPSWDSLAKALAETTREAVRSRMGIPSGEPVIGLGGGKFHAARMVHEFAEGIPPEFVVLASIHPGATEEEKQAFTDALRQLRSRVFRTDDLKIPAAKIMIASNYYFCGIVSTMGEQANLLGCQPIAAAHAAELGEMQKLSGGTEPSHNFFVKHGFTLAARDARELRHIIETQAPYSRLPRPDGQAATRVADAITEA